MGSLKRTCSRRVPLAALIIYTFVITLLRAFRSPNDFAEAHWLLDYRFGFVKRGLIGEIVSLVMGFMSRPITERKIFILSGIAFLIYCTVITVSTMRIIQRSEWSAGAVAVTLVFLSSPFVVMSAHLVGYFDNIIIVIGIFSALLIIKGKPWPGACLQILALLIHESSMLLVFPTFCLALFLMNSRNNKSGIHITSFLPLLIPTVAFIVLMVAHEMFLAENFVESFTKYLSRFPFIQDNRSTYAPAWISRSFLDYYESESGEFFQRITSAAMYRLVLPSVLAILYFIKRVYRVRLFSTESLVLIGVCLVPQIMHLVAWDTSRIWTYTIFCAFFVLWIYSEIIPGHKDSSVSRFLSLGALVANVVILTPLMDKQIDHFSLMTRLFLYTPVILISLGLILYQEYIDRRKGF